MKSSLIISCLAFLLSISRPLSAQDGKSLPVSLNRNIDIGIIDVYDHMTHLNYNHAYKLFLLDQKLKKGTQSAKIELIEHFSQAKYAVRIFIDTFTYQFVQTTFCDGKVIAKDTVSLFDDKFKAAFLCPPFRLVTSPHGTIQVAGLCESSIAFKQGLRNGDILASINGKETHPFEISDIWKMLTNAQQKELKITYKRSSTDKARPMTLKKELSTPAFRANALTNIEVTQIFKKSLERLLNNSSTIKLASGSININSSIARLRPEFETGNCKVSKQIATVAKADHPIRFPSTLVTKENFKTEDIFISEKFIPQAVSGSKYKPGDAALMPLKHYAYHQNGSTVVNHKEVSDELKRSIRELSGPFFFKPGVFLNYCIAGYEYEKTGNYSAAMNQYYASVRIINTTITSELSKLRAKAWIAKRLSQCASQSGQPQYARMMDVAHACLVKIQQHPDLIQANKEFYTFTTEITTAGTTLEQQIAEQRSEKFFAIVNTTLNVAAGVASFNYDAGLSQDYFLTAFTVMDEFSTYNQAVNSMIRESTESMEIHLPVELINDEPNPYLITATKFIAESFLRDPAFMQFDSNFDTLGDDAVRNAWKQCKESKDITGKWELGPFIQALAKFESTVYSYEKSGRAVPERT